MKSVLPSGSELSWQYVQRFHESFPYCLHVGTCAFRSSLQNRPSNTFHSDTAFSWEFRTIRGSSLGHPRKIRIQREGERGRERERAGRDEDASNQRSQPHLAQGTRLRSESETCSCEPWTSRYFLIQRENFGFVWLPSLVLMKNFEVVIPWWSENRAYETYTARWSLKALLCSVAIDPCRGPLLDPGVVYSMGPCFVYCRY